MGALLPSRVLGRRCYAARALATWTGHGSYYGRTGFCSATQSISEIIRTVRQRLASTLDVIDAALLPSVLLSGLPVSMRVRNLLTLRTVDSEVGPAILLEKRVLLQIIA